DVAGSRDGDFHCISSSKNEACIMPQNRGRRQRGSLIETQVPLTDLAGGLRYYLPARCNDVEAIAEGCCELSADTHRPDGSALAENQDERTI
ncbi:MAG TPA: hypothetical protein VFW59_07445, partial [Gallionella sp.]|nr:hypothetical protein [Gallionella sp.]